MTPRQRAHRILNHQEADRPAIDLGATRMTGTSAWTYGALKRALGITGGHTRVYDLFQMLAEVEEPVLEALGCDFAMVPDPHLPYGLTRGDWQEFTFWDGQTFEVPAGFRPQRLANGDLLIGDGADWTEPVARMPHGGRYFDAIHVPNLTDTFEIPHLNEDQWALPGPLSDAVLASYRDRIAAQRATTDRALVVTPPFNLTSGYGGLFQWAMKMAVEPDHCLAYTVAHAQAMAVRARQFLSAVGGDIDVVVLSGADYGTQDREAFRPALFGRCMAPAWKVLCDAVHEFAGVKVWIHTCGSVPGLIPYIAAAGVDCLNPVQWGAAGMDRGWLKDSFGQQLTFWGGAINTQSTFAFGTAEEVRREALDCLRIFAPGGGFVVNPIHNIQADVPVANILALYEEARKWSY